MRYSVLAVALVATQFVGCASIVNGTNQSISVETRTTEGAVSGAACTLTNNKGTWFLTSPGSAMVHRSFEDLSVRCEKDSHEPAIMSAKSGTKGMAFGNILFGGFIGAGVDMSTGAAYDYPTLITVMMAKTGTAATPTAAPLPSSPAASAVPIAGMGTEKPIAQTTAQAIAKNETGR